MLSDRASFLDELMRYVVDDLVQVPKAQVERVVGPILGLFIANVFSELLQDEVRMICPEFPLRKQDSNQSTNLDWLLYASTRDQLLLVELKTTDTTYREDQASIYRDIIGPIERMGIAHLVANIESIRSASREWGKYDSVLSRARQPEYLACRNAALVYLAPKCSHPDSTPVKKSALRTVTAQHVLGLATGDSLWLSFGDLPQEIPSRFADEWRVIRKWLVQLDDITRRSRNGLSDDTSQRNFRGTCTFDELTRRCKDDPDGIVIGYEGGISRLCAATLDELQQRSAFKWDHASQGTGRKDNRNWILGRRFLEVIDHLRGTRDQGSAPAHGEREGCGQTDSSCKVGMATAIGPARRNATCETDRVKNFERISIDPPPGLVSNGKSNSADPPV